MADQGIREAVGTRVTYLGAGALIGLLLTVRLAAPSTASWFSTAPTIEEKHSLQLRYRLTLDEKAHVKETTAKRKDRATKATKNASLKTTEEGFDALQASW